MLSRGSTTMAAASARASGGTASLARRSTPSSCSPAAPQRSTSAPATPSARASKPGSGAAAAGPPLPGGRRADSSAASSPGDSVCTAPRDPWVHHECTHACGIHPPPPPSAAGILPPPHRQVISRTCSAPSVSPPPRQNAAAHSATRTVAAPARWAVCTQKQADLSTCVQREAAVTLWTHPVQCRQREGRGGQGSCFGSSQRHPAECSALQKPQQRGNTRPCDGLNCRGCRALPRGEGPAQDVASKGPQKLDGDEDAQARSGVRRWEAERRVDKRLSKGSGGGLYTAKGRGSDGTNLQRRRRL